MRAICVACKFPTLVHIIFCAGTAQSAAVVARLSALLATVLNTTGVDRRCKAAQSALFKEAYYEPAVQVRAALNIEH